MGDTFNSSGGTQIIAKGKGAIGQVNNYNAPQAPAEDLLKLLAEIKARLPELPEKERVKLRNAVEEVEMEAQADKPDREEIAATLTRAQKVLKAIPGTVAAALPVGELVGKAQELLNQAEARDVQAIEQMEKTTKLRRISAADTNVSQARLQRLQWHHAKAAALLPCRRRARRNEQRVWATQAMTCTALASTRRHCPCMSRGWLLTGSWETGRAKARH